MDKILTLAGKRATRSVASVGDSRAIAIKRGPNDTLVSESLTAEHDLYRQDEQERLSKFDVEFTTMSQAEGKVPKGGGGRPQRKEIVLPSPSGAMCRLKPV